MARTTQDEREALRQAAEAVRPKLEKLRQERTVLDERIARLESVVAVYEEACGRRPRQEGNGAGGNKIKRGQVNEHVAAVLTGGGEHDEPEIRRMIAQRFGVVYSRATVYSALRRGRPQYEQVGRKWRKQAAA